MAAELPRLTPQPAIAGSVLAVACADASICLTPFKDVVTAAPLRSVGLLAVSLIGVAGAVIAGVVSPV